MLARQDCEKMSEKAVEVGMGKIFNAAILALQRQDEDSKAALGLTRRQTVIFFPKSLAGEAL